MRGWCKKQIILWILGAVMLLTGCSSSIELPSEQKHVTVTVWTKDKHDLRFWQEKIKEFNDSNQNNITIKYEVYSNNYTQVVNNALENGSAPDIMAFSGDSYHEYVNQRKFADIMPYMDQELQDIFSDVMLEGVNCQDGKCYYLPTGASVCRLIYNRDIFEQVGIEQPPQTLEEMIEDAKRINDTLSEAGIYGFAVNLKEAKTGLSRSFMPEAILETGVKNGFDFKNGRYDFSVYQELIEKWRILLSDECAYPDCENLSIDPLREQFAAGKIGMYFTYSFSETGVYRDQFPTEEDWDIVGIPIQEGFLQQSQSYTLTGGYLFNAASEHMEEAWEAYRSVFADIDHLAEHYMEGLSASVLPRVIERAEEENGRMDKDILLGEHDRLWPTAPHDLNKEYLHITGEDMYETIKRLLLGTGQIEPALEELSRRYNQGYEEAVDNGLCRDMRISDFDPANPTIS